VQINSTVTFDEYTTLKNQIVIPFTINLIPLIKQLASTLPNAPIIETLSLKLVPVQASAFLSNIFIASFIIIYLMVCHFY
jgi:hypothetical protein